MKFERMKIYQMRRANCRNNSTPKIVHKEFQAHQETNESNLELISGLTRLLHLSFANKNNKLHSTLSEARRG